MPSPVPLNHFVREWRKHRELTLPQLATQVGTSKGNISLIENGKSGLTPAMAEAIAKVLNIDAETLRHRAPGQEATAEQDLLELFRTSSADVQKAMLASVRAIAQLGRKG